MQHYGYPFYFIFYPLFFCSLWSPLDIYSSPVRGRNFFPHPIANANQSHLHMQLSIPWNNSSVHLSLVANDSQLHYPVLNRRIRAYCALFPWLCYIYHTYAALHMMTSRTCEGLRKWNIIIYLTCWNIRHNWIGPIADYFVHRTPVIIHLVSHWYIRLFYWCLTVFPQFGYNRASKFFDEIFPDLQCKSQHEDATWISRK